MALIVATGLSSRVMTTSSPGGRLWMSSPRWLWAASRGIICMVAPAVRLEDPFLCYSPARQLGPLRLSASWPDDILDWLKTLLDLRGSLMAAGSVPVN